MHIAIFGCGQLAQMTAQAGLKLGLTFVFIADPGEDTRCVDDLGDVVICETGISAQQLFESLGQPAVITVEKEMVDTALLTQLTEYTAIYPAADAIHITQNRVREKNFLRQLDIPTADFEIIQSLEQLETLPERLGLPIYIKAAESGYDGYNQWRITEATDLEQTALRDAVTNGVEIIAEKHVDYLREVSVIAARNPQGEIVRYPLMENRHEEGVLLATVAPAPMPRFEQQAFDFMARLLDELQYVGILTMECFETADGIVANELAPRVHNSGHWTIEGSATSQFSNHCRAVAQQPLGSTAPKGMAGLVNMLGKHGDPADFASVNTYYHDYGKQERPRRKLGHVSAVADNLDELKIKLNHALVTLYGDHYKPL